MGETESKDDGFWLGLARVIAGLDAQGVMKVLGTFAAVVGGWIAIGIVSPGAIPFTAGVKSAPQTWGVAAAFTMLGVALIVRSATEAVVQKVDKSNRMGVVSWTYPQQQFHLRSIKVPGKADGEVWMDVCCHGVHSPQKVAVLESGWVQNMFLDLAGTKGPTEITFYRAKDPGNSILDIRATKAIEDDDFQGMSTQSWPKDGMSELFTLQVDRI